MDKDKATIDSKASIPPSSSGSASTPASTPSDEEPRVSQRASLSCIFCTKRKIRCDRNVPCSACIRRGHPETCTRRPTIVRGKLVNAPAPRAPLSDEQIQALRQAQLQRENLNLRKRVAELERQLRALPSVDAKADSSSTSRRMQQAFDSVSESSSIQPQSSSQSQSQDPLRHFVRVMGVPQDTPAAVEFDSSSPRQSPPLQDLPSRASINLANADLFSLVPHTNSSLIVRASFKYMTFIHCAMHVPTWLADHDRWIESISRGEGRDKSDAWIASYFAILSVGMYYAGDLLAPELGYSLNEIAELASGWFDVCLEALNRSKFLSTNPTIEALQTIVIVPAVAYNFGASAYTENLVHIGLRIAQLLRLHLLGPEPDHIPPGLIHRELGRRIWLVLRLGEDRPDFVQPGALRLPQGVTVEPFNADDDDLCAGLNRPLSEPTVTSHLIAAGRRCAIFRQFSDACTTATSVEEQYEFAKAAHNALRSSIACFPHLCKPMAYPETLDLHGPYSYVAHSNYIFSVLNPAGTILLYRSFLGRAYVDERYASVRQMCLDAAREILAVRQKPVPGMFKRAWPVAAYTIVSGLILATELAHGSPDPQTRAKLVTEVEFVISSLWECGTASLVVQRGVPLLQGFLDRSRADYLAATNEEMNYGSSSASLASLLGTSTGVSNGAGETVGTGAGGSAVGAGTGSGGHVGALAISCVPPAEALWPASMPDFAISEDIWSHAMSALENQDPSLWLNGII